MPNDWQQNGGETSHLKKLAFADVYKHFCHHRKLGITISLKATRQDWPSLGVLHPPVLSGITASRSAVCRDASIREMQLLALQSACKQRMRAILMIRS